MKLVKKIFPNTYDSGANFCELYVIRDLSSGFLLNHEIVDLLKEVSPHLIWTYIDESLFTKGGCFFE